MKHIQSDKHTIAWFKIAECVSRGEKERALGVYRLLSHSFNDVAVARQLEGDIYLCFQDHDTAIQYYQQAADLYKKAKRFLEAVAVYEHLLTLQKNNISFRREIIDLYKKLNIKTKIHKHIQKVLDTLLTGDDQKTLQELLSTLQAVDEKDYQFACNYLKKNE